MNSTSMAAARMIVRQSGVYRGSVEGVPLPNELYSLEIEQLSESIVREKVSSLLLRRLHEHRPELVEKLSRQPTLSKARARIEALVRHEGDVLSLIGREAEALGFPVWAVKGLAARPKYHDPGVRDLGDLDLMVAGVDEAIRLTDRLCSAGYEFHGQELPWIKRSLETGVIYGQFSLKRGAPEQEPAIDLHFGGYSIRHCGLHRLGDGDRRPGLRYYSTQQNLPLIVGNAAGDHEITTKDLSDLAIAMTDEAIDWPTVLEELDEVKLLGFFRRMVDQLEATPLRSSYLDSPLPPLLKDVRREVPAPHPSGSRRRRWAATVSHAFAVGARHSSARAAVTSLSAARYYWGDRTMSVRSGKGRAVPRLPKLTSWTCVRLVPATMLRRLHDTDSDVSPGPRFLDVSGPERQLSDELVAISSPIGDVVRSCLGDFLPAVFHLDVAPELLAEKRNG
jgi:hypothetical protein